MAELRYLCNGRDDGGGRMSCRQCNGCCGSFHVMGGDTFNSMYGDWFCNTKVVFFCGGKCNGRGAGGPGGYDVHGH